MNGEKWLNGNLAQRVPVILLTAAVAAGWAFLSSRASDDDVKKNEKAIEDVQKKVAKKLQVIETNIVRTCQFLDRQDKLAGGPGLDCKDPE